MKNRIKKDPFRITRKLCSPFQKKKENFKLQTWKSVF